MPIRPENRKRYPPNWAMLRQAILTRAYHACEGSPAYPDCRAANGQPHPVTGSRVVLTIAHLRPPIEDCRLENLRAMCQRCHLTYDSAQHRATAAATRMRAREAAGQGVLYAVESPHA